MLASKIPSNASNYMNPALAGQFDYNSTITEFHYVLEDYVNLQEKIDRLEFASLQLEKQERLTEQMKEKLDNTYDRLSQITNKKKKEAAKIEQLKHLSIRSFFSKIKGTRSSELGKAEKAYQNTCKQYEQAKKAYDVNKSLWDESKKELLECQTNNKNFNRYKNELEELLQEVFDGPTPNFPQEDALEQQVMKLFLNFTQLSQVIHQCELAKDNLRNAHMYLVNFFKGGQSVRDYASIWDLSPTSVIKILKENEKHDDITVLSDAKDFVKQANEKIQHARVLLTKKTNLTSNKIERLEDLLESVVDNQEIGSKDGIRRIDSNLEKELGETRIWLDEEIQSLKTDYSKQEKELAIYKTKLFEERQRILNLWVINLDDTVKKRMIENSSARGRKRSKSKILKSIGQEDESDSNWFDNSGITCAADLAVRNNTISRNTSIKSSATLFNKDIDTLKVGSCPASNGFYTLNNINQYMGSTPSLEYYHDPIYNSLPRWPMSHQNNSLYTIPDNNNTSGFDFSLKAQSEIVKNHDVKFSDSQSQGDSPTSSSHPKNNVSLSPSNTLENSSSSPNASLNHSRSQSKKSPRNHNTSLKHSNTRTSKKSILSRSNTKNSHSSNHFGHATTSAININGSRTPPAGDYSMPNLLNTSFASLPNSFNMMGGGYNQNAIPRINSPGSNYMYNRYSMDQFALQSAYLSQYYPYNTSVPDINTSTAAAAAIYNPLVLSNSYLSPTLNTPLGTSLPATTMSPITAHNSINLGHSNLNNNGNLNTSNSSSIQRSRSAIVSHVMDKPLNRVVVNDTINLNIPSSPKTSHKRQDSNSNGGSTPNIAQLQQSPMFPFPQRSRSVSVLNSKSTEDTKKNTSFIFHKKKFSNGNSFNGIYDHNVSPSKPIIQNREGKLSFSKRPVISLEDITGSTSVILDEEEDQKSVEIIHDVSENEQSETSSITSSSTSSSSSEEEDASSSSIDEESDNSLTSDEEEEEESLTSTSSSSETNSKKEEEEKPNELESSKPIITDRMDSKDAKNLFENPELLNVNVDKLMTISSTPSIQ